MSKLHIVTCLSNPLQWRSRVRNTITAVRNWLENEQVHVTVVECVPDGFPFALQWLANDRMTHIAVHSNSLIWNKESLLNIGIKNLPADCEYVLTADADVVFFNYNWAADIINVLQNHDVVQPWRTCFDLGPDFNPMTQQNSFAYVNSFATLRDLNPHSVFIDEAGVEHRGHPGYCWGWRADFLHRLTAQTHPHGPLLHVAALGGADKYMAHGLLGAGHTALPMTMHPNYHEAVALWGAAAMSLDPRISYVNQAINHLFHGYKPKRAYKTRPEMLQHYGYDPYTDIKLNKYGVLEWLDPMHQFALQQEILHYFKSRDEDEDMPIRRRDPKEVVAPMLAAG